MEMAEYWSRRESEAELALTYARQQIAKLAMDGQIELDIDIFAK